MGRNCPAIFSPSHLSQKNPSSTRCPLGTLPVSADSLARPSPSQPVRLSLQPLLRSPLLLPTLPSQLWRLHPRAEGVGRPAPLKKELEYEAPEKLPPPRQSPCTTRPRCGTESLEHLPGGRSVPAASRRPADQAGDKSRFSQKPAGRGEIPFSFLLFSRLFPGSGRSCAPSSRGNPRRGGTARPPSSRARLALAVSAPRGQRAPGAPAPGSGRRARGPGSKPGYLGITEARTRLGTLVSSSGGSSVGHAGGIWARRAARVPRTQSPERPPRAGTRALVLRAGLGTDSARPRRPSGRAVPAPGPETSRLAHLVLPSASPRVGGYGPLRPCDFKEPGGASAPACNTAPAGHAGTHPNLVPLGEPDWTRGSASFQPLVPLCRRDL